MKYYVYVYFADGKPFYVGKGKGDRYKQNLKHPQSSYLRNKIAKFKSEAIKITVRRMAFFSKERDAFKREILLIAKYRTAGYKLCNLTDGGEGKSGCECTIDTRVKHSLASKKALNRPEVKEKLSASQRASWQRPKERARRIAAMRKAQKRPEVKLRKSLITKKVHNRPEIKKSKSKAMKKSHRNPEVKAKRTKAYNSRDFFLKCRRGNKYFGVEKHGNRWRAKYRSIRLGSFPTEIEAARAFNKTAPPHLRNRIDNISVKIDRRNERR